MPNRSANGTPTSIKSLPPSPPLYVSPNHSYSSNESNETSPEMSISNLPPTPQKSTPTIAEVVSNPIPIASTSTSSHRESTEEEELFIEDSGERPFGATMTRSLTPPDWRLSILAQKKYSGQLSSSKTSLSFFYNPEISTNSDWNLLI